MSDWVAILTGFFGSAGLFTFVQYLIVRHDKRSDRLVHIEHQLDKNEKDSCRTQLLLLMKDYPEAKSEIMKLAYHYFVELKGNWFATDIFRNYLEKNNITPPLWFKKMYDAD